MSSEIVRDIKDALQKAQKSISAVAASHMRPERLLKVALAATQRNTQLLECSSQSLVRAVVGCAELGLEPNALGHAYLVPFRNNGRLEVQLIIGYRGLIELAYRSGRIQSVDVQSVFEGDRFMRKCGLDPVLDHEPCGEDDPAKLTGVYAIVRFKDGGMVYEYMTRKQVERIRSRSRAKDKGPWVTDYEEMCKKTVLRRVLKRCPMSIEMAKAEAISMGEASDASGFEFLDLDSQEAEVVDVDPNHTTKELARQMGDPEQLFGKEEPTNE